jgi:hypothetical protein
MTQLEPVFKPLEKLIGTWKTAGKTLGSKEDNIFGEVKIEPILDGAYLQISGHMSFKDGMLDFPSIEIIGYDKEKKTFPSTAFANMGETSGEAPVLYEWYVEEDGTVVHRGAGAIYHGKFSDDGNVLDGGWRPDTSEDRRDEASYDLTMTRLS